MEPEVAEISPPWKLKAKALKRKQVAYHEIIDVDMDEVCNDVVLIQGNKKVKDAISLGPSNAEQGSMHSAQTRNKVDSNNKANDVSMMGGVHNSRSFIDLDDYAFEDDDYSMALQLQSQFDNMDIPTTGIKADNFQIKVNSSTCSGVHANNSSKKNPGSCSSMGKVVDNEDVLVRYESFKKFDIVVDYSDHHLATKSSSLRELIVARRVHRRPLALPSIQPTKNWVKRIQNEWRILKENLPDTIFVRAYESRMDLLRAVIIGAEGTPYHDALFFFDVCFTRNYPDCPPLVHYDSISYPMTNRNIHGGNGKVCLSLLNTWGGQPNEMWVPGTSTMLQVLVSLQGLVLNAKPYFNFGLGYESKRKSKNGISETAEKSSIRYNEVVLIASLRTMVSTMGKPPKNFEDFVRGHFRKRARDILMAGKAYTEGVKVGSVVRGGVQDLDEEEEANYNNSWSDITKSSLVANLKILVTAFKQIGAVEADEEFTWLTEKNLHLL